MKITKVKDVKTPTRGTNKSAGLDFYVPNTEKVHTVNPGGHVVIGSGIKVKVPKNYALIAFNKSSTAILKRLHVGACVVDEDYQGEIHIHLSNIGSDVETISPGDKIVQFILIPILYAEVEEVTYEELYSNESTARGEGWKGSTGTN